MTNQAIAFCCCLCLTFNFMQFFMLWTLTFCLKCLRKSLGQVITCIIITEKNRILLPQIFSNRGHFWDIQVLIFPFLQWSHHAHTHHAVCCWFPDEDLTMNTQVCLIEQKHVTTRLLHMNYGVTAGLHGLALSETQRESDSSLALRGDMLLLATINHCSISARLLGWLEKQ